MRLISTSILSLATLGNTAAQSISELVGTWTTKSNSTITGPEFYDPIADHFIEPAHTGISYSFTEDGYYEEAYFRSISDPTNPECASAILQFQHGSFQLNSNGSLSLTPIGIDGRQLESAPCKSKKSIYSRFNQSELHQTFAQYVDPFHGVPRLDLYQHNGAPLPPMYLAFKPPQMLPTTTLHKAATASATGTTNKFKRTIADVLPRPKSVEGLDADKVWWFGLGMTGVGSVLYWCF